MRCRGRRRHYAVFLLLVILAYAMIYGWLLIRTDYLPYVMDNNESFSSLIHAANLYRFGLRKSVGLTDEAYGPNPVAHPYVHTHQGNVPRIFAFIIYLLGARTIESQILVTTFTIGVAAIFLAYHYFTRVSNPLFALIACLVFMTDYIFFAQWQIVTYRVWHGFFVFSSLLCAHGIGNPRRRLWTALTFANYLFLFYFEFIFVVFLAVFIGLYTACLYVRSPRMLLTAWASQAAGGLAGMLLLVFQLAAYMGSAALAKDVYLTVAARNYAASDPDLVAKAREFYQSHNVVFWYYFVDSGPLRTLGSFARSLFTWNFQVYSPLFTLLVLIVVGGCLLGLPQWRPIFRTERLRRSMARLRTALKVDVPYLSARFHASLQIHSGIGQHRSERIAEAVRSMVRLVPIGLSLYVLFLVALRYPALMGLPSSDPIAWQPSWSLRGMAGIAALLGCLALAQLATNGWSGLARIPLYRVLLLLLLLWGAQRFLSKQHKLYDQSFQLLWFGRLETWLPSLLNRAAVLAALGMAIAMALLGTRRLLGRNDAKRLRALVRFLGCGFLAYAFVYWLSPGYVLSGYLRRAAPLAVFLIDVLIAITIYVLLVSSTRAFRLLASSRVRFLSHRLDVRGFVVGRRGVLAQALLAGGLTLFIVGYWVHIQGTYLTLLPPNHFAFLKALRTPPFSGASFVSNTYAAPIAAMTGQWAYYDPNISTGYVGLTDTGYVVERDTTSYLWFADKRQNADYLTPQYYACMVLESFATVLGRIQDKVGHYKLCSGLGIVERSQLENQEVLQHRLVAIDGSGRDSWAIVKLDWDYPPHLRPVPGPDPDARVQLLVSGTENGAMVRVFYDYAHQEGKAESGSRIRLYGVRRNGGRYLIRETTMLNRLSLPADFRGKIQVSVTPRTSTKSGPEYFSRIARVEPRSRLDVNTPR